MCGNRRFRAEIVSARGHAPAESAVQGRERVLLTAASTLILHLRQAWTTLDLGARTPRGPLGPGDPPAASPRNLACPGTRRELFANTTGPEASLPSAVELARRGARRGARSSDRPTARRSTGTMCRARSSCATTPARDRRPGRASSRARGRTLRAICRAARGSWTSRTASRFAETVLELRQDPRVAYAVPNYVARATALTPNDPGFGLQWNFWGPAGINMPEAWSLASSRGAPGGRGAVVAVLDTGVAYRRLGPFRRAPDLCSFVRGYDFIQTATAIPST